MNLRMIYRYFLLSVCIVYSIKVYAQKSMHRYEATLGAVTKDGFYRISITPEVYGRCRPFFPDLRILDDRNTAVPYMTGYRTQETINIDFPVEQEGLEANKQYAVVLSNPGRSFCDRFNIKLKNSDVIRSLSLSGSDDNKEWYAIREDFYWDVYTIKGANSIGAISAPLTNYRFFKLTFNGADKLPLKILSVSSVAYFMAKVPYLEVPDPKVIQKDSSDHKSYITLQFPYPYLVDRLEIDCHGPKYFHRGARFSSNGFSQTGHDPIQAISSGTQPIYFLGGNKATEIYIQVNNEDNPPLIIAGVKAYQYEETIVTYLEANKRYRLTFGDSTATRPTYDLAYFKDSVGKQLSELAIGEIRNVVPGTVNVTKKSDNKWLLWPLLVVLLAGLSLVTFKMVKKIGTES